LDSNPSKHIVAADFTCLAEPQLDDADCPCISGKFGGPRLSYTGAYSCPTCKCIVGFEDGEDDLMFDEDDEEEMDFAQGNNFVAEGDRLQDFTPEENLFIKRRKALNVASVDIHILNNRLADYLVTNEFEIVQFLRNLELANEPTFGKTGTNLTPKILAIASFLGNIPIESKTLAQLKINPTVVTGYIRALKIIIPTEGSKSPMVQALTYVGNAIDLPNPIVESIIQQYEEDPLYNRESDTTTRAAAFIYVKTRQAGIKAVTQGALKKIPGVRHNSLPRAIAIYNDQIRNGNNGVEAEGTL